MTKNGLLVLDFWGSPFCMRVKIALAEKGVAFESQEEDLFGGKSELLLTSNPVYEKVPVLLHNDKPTVESTNIVTYIDETWASPPLLPACAYGRARARFWAHYVDEKVNFFFLSLIIYSPQNAFVCIYLSSNHMIFFPFFFLHLH